MVEAERDLRARVQERARARINLSIDLQQYDKMDLSAHNLNQSLLLRVDTVSHLVGPAELQGGGTAQVPAAERLRAALLPRHARQ